MTSATLLVTLWMLPVVGLAQPGVAPGSQGEVQAELVIRRAGSFTLELRTDLDALLLGVGPGASLVERVHAMEALSDADMERAVARLSELFRRRIRVRFDGAPAAFSVDYPESRLRDGRLVSLGNKVLLEGAVPGDASRVSFSASRSFGPILLIVEVERDPVDGDPVEAAARRVIALLEAGARSTPLELDRP